ncbi:serine/threonine-protein kinase [[Mycoplasma] mobile]|uniref:non-specific serine/threonine protein kinase n=1 Tax=Mycoplasma mobile (strain ATCC 43663 / 163K / NCTC 11711) TaxID=267748 RepID=Q6KH85_MYCM1|nr:serine/threonine-protein kinase [[Mycoplasma] mobile]AAT28045.1 serine/threonine protein kinase [Mycoplasma mobile 163K]
MDIKNSKRITEKYINLKPIGKGGMAHVYRAEAKDTGVKVAIKTIGPETSGDSNFIINKKRFKEEMKIAQKISNPHIIKFYQGVFDDKDQYIVMEFVDGITLGEYIKERTKLRVDEVVDFAKQIVKGFVAIHSNGIVHRDLKSANIMVDKTNKIKIIDFGIALEDNSVRYTATNKVIGSVQYMAPEILNKQSATIQSDIYALGILLYEMLIGMPPYKEDTPLATAQKHLTGTIKPVNEIDDQIPQSVANIVIKATAKSRTARYKSMDEILVDLESALDPEKQTEKKIDLRPVQEKVKFKSILKNRTTWISISAIVLIIIIISLSVGIGLGR